MNPLEAFPGGADEARDQIDRMRRGVASWDEMQRVANLALAHLDSLAADPEREAKVERALEALMYAQSYYETHPQAEFKKDRDDALDSCRALLRHAPTSPSVAAEKIVRDVAELPDRDSPEDWPEAMLVTGDELRAIVLAALAASNANARGGE